jgi:hypothetical protein
MAEKRIININEIEREIREEDYKTFQTMSRLEHRQYSKGLFKALLIMNKNIRNISNGR